MSVLGIYHKVNYLYDPPKLPDGALYVAVFFKKMSVTMCLTGLYWGIGLNKVILETVGELTTDPEDLPREDLFETIPWNDVELIVVLGTFIGPPEVTRPLLTALPGRPPVPNDVPVYHKGEPITDEHRDQIKLPDMRYKPYYKRFRTPSDESELFSRPDTRSKPFWENYLPLQLPVSPPDVHEPMDVDRGKLCRMAH